MKEPDACGLAQQGGVRQETFADFDLRLAMMVLVELKHWCGTVLRANERSSNEERVSPCEQAVAVKLAPGNRGALRADGVAVDAQRVSVETQA